MIAPTMPEASPTAAPMPAPINVPTPGMIEPNIAPAPAAFAHDRADDAGSQSHGRADARADQRADAGDDRANHRARARVAEHAFHRSARASGFEIRQRVLVCGITRHPNRGCSANGIGSAGSSSGRTARRESTANALASAARA